MEGNPLPLWLLFLFEFALFLLLWVFQVVENHCHKEIQQDLVGRRKVVSRGRRGRREGGGGEEGGRRGEKGEE